MSIAKFLANRLRVCYLLDINLLNYIRYDALYMLKNNYLCTDMCAVNFGVHILLWAQWFKDYDCRDTANTLWWPLCRFGLVGDGGPCGCAVHTAHAEQGSSLGLGLGLGYRLR